MHLSTRLPGNFWVVEVRRPAPWPRCPIATRARGPRSSWTAAAGITLLAPYPLRRHAAGAVAIVDRGAAASRTRAAVPRTGRPPDSLQLRHSAVAAVDVPDGVRHRAGQRGDAVGRRVRSPPSSSRGSCRRGIQIAPLLLHTASRASRITSRRTRNTSACRRRRPTASTRPGAPAIASSRSARRSCARSRLSPTIAARTSPGEGWTSLVITPDRPLRAVNGMITGLHEPRATHLAMVEQVMAAAGSARRRRTSSAPTARRSRQATCGTSSATRT